MPESVVAYRVVATTWWEGGDYLRAQEYFEKAVAAIGSEGASARTQGFRRPRILLWYFSALVRLTVRARLQNKHSVGPYGADIRPRSCTGNS
jgi:hypothetical protein